MTPAVELLARLRARGVVLEPDGGILVVRPAGAVQPQEVAALRRHKAEVLAMLRGRWWPSIALNLVTVGEVLGPTPDEHALACLHLDVLGAVRQLEREVAADSIRPTPLLVRGRPLGDLLDLGDVARLLASRAQRSTR